jgi:hypothetical protein
MLHQVEEAIDIGCGELPDQPVAKGGLAVVDG